MSLKLKRHYKLIVVLVLVSAVLTLGFGDRQIIAYTIDDSSLWTGVAGLEAIEAGAALGSGMVLPDDAGALTIPIVGYRTD